MLVSDVKAEVAEVIGKCADDPLIYQSITRACELLANKRLIDPLKGYLDVTLPSGAYYFAMPKEVKTPLKVNINNNPAFTRGQIFEFLQNTDGTVTGAELGWQWSDRGWLPIQFPNRLPGVLNYLASNASDNGATITVTGRDTNGVMQTEQLIASSTSPTAGTINFATVETILRSATSFYTTLRQSTNAVGIYQPTEIDPQYRFIKVSRAASALRVIYRKWVFKITSDDDIVPCPSALALIHACRAVRWYANNDYINGALALNVAVQFLNEEQDSREENLSFALASETLNTINADMYVADGIIVRDLYDAACDIFGSIGRAKIFDRIEVAFELLKNKAHWQSDLGVVDIIAAGDGAWTPARCDCAIAAVQEADPQASSDAKSGRQAIGSGVDYVDVVFSTAYAAGVTPSIGGCMVQKGDSGDPDITTTSLGTVTNEGFRIYLSATTGTANYILHWNSSV